MSDPLSETYKYLLANYGPLLTLKHMAEVMHATPNGVRMAIARRRQPFAVGLAGAQRRLGRRIYFEARRVAAMIDHGVPCTSPRKQALSEEHPAAEADVSIQQAGCDQTHFSSSPQRCTEMERTDRPKQQAVTRQHGQVQRPGEGSSAADVQPYIGE